MNLGLTLQQVRDLPLEDLRSWSKYDELEWLPDRRTEIQLAQIAHILATTNSRTPGKYKLSDFMPSQEPEAQDPDEFLRRLRGGT